MLSVRGIVGGNLPIVRLPLLLFLGTTIVSLNFQVTFLPALASQPPKL
jgi:hypothetical protein